MKHKQFANLLLFVTLISCFETTLTKNFWSTKAFLSIRNPFHREKKNQKQEKEETVDFQGFQEVVSPVSLALQSAAIITTATIVTLAVLRYLYPDMSTPNAYDAIFVKITDPENTQINISDITPYGSQYVSITNKNIHTGSSSLFCTTIK